MIDSGVCVFTKETARRGGEEAEWLLAVIREEVWRHVNCVSLWEYLELRFGFGPRVARDRVRVAEALQELPLVADAMADGLCYSAVRELTRVVRPNTQREWLDAVHGKNLRQIEDLVAEHKEGDLPTDPPDPSLRKVRIVLEVSQAQAAQFSEMQRHLANEHGERLDDDRLVEAMCAAVFDAGENSNEASRPRHQIATTICSECHAGWQDGGGRVARMSDAEIERAECDAQRIGSIEEPARAKSDISPMTRRTVWRRDHGKCVVLDCRSGRNLDVHHIVGRAEGGSHGAHNLVLLCGGHHGMLHEGKLSIAGRAPNVFIEKGAIEYAPDELNAPYERDEWSERDESDAFYERNERDERNELNEPGKLKEPDEPGKLNEPYEPNELNEPGELNESGELNELADLDAPNALMEAVSPGGPAPNAPSARFLRPGAYRMTEKGLEPQIHDEDSHTRLVSILGQLGRAHVGR